MGKPRKGRRPPVADPKPPADHAAGGWQPPDDAPDHYARIRQLRHVNEQFERCRRRHELGDPCLGAWAAYDIATSSGVQVPAWVTTYLRRVAAKMLKISAPPPNVPGVSRKRPSGRPLATMVLRALEITGGQGPGLLRKRETAQGRAAIAEEVRELVEGGMQRKAAIATVSERRAISASTVEFAIRASRKPSKSGPTL